VNEQELKILTSEVKQKMMKHRDTYSSQKEAAQNRIQSWISDSEKVTKELDLLIGTLNTQMSAKLKRIISQTQIPFSDKITQSDIDFDKLAYFIDQLNDKTVPSHIIEKNPHYAETVLTTIAEEYLKIKAYITNERNAKQKEKSTCGNDVADSCKKQVMIEWNNLCNVELKRIAQREADIIVSKIQNLV
jgi:hypothetical protein